jgi:hypothetical protein
MDFRIAETFTDSLARLTGDEQNALRVGPLQISVSSLCLTPSTASQLLFTLRPLDAGLD